MVRRFSDSQAGLQATVNLIGEYDELTKTLNHHCASWLEAPSKKAKQKDTRSGQLILESETQRAKEINKTTRTQQQVVQKWNVMQYQKEGDCS